MSRLHNSICPKTNPAIESLESRLYRSADLTGMFSGATPTKLDPTNRNRAAIEVENTGDSSATGLVTVDLYAAAGITPDDGSILLASVTRNVKLKPGGESAVKFRFAEPAGLADGLYSLLAQIDASDISDAIATNDIVVAPSPVQVKQPFVDLTAQNVQGPVRPIFIDDDIVSGGPASVVVENRGTEAARGTISVDFYLSPDSTLDSAAFPAGATPEKSIGLQPGRSEKFNSVFDPPAATAAGNYFLFAVLTSGGGIVQTNAGDEVGEAKREVVVVRGVAPATPQPPVAGIYYDGPTVICVPGCVGETAPCAPSDSTPSDNSTPSGTLPTTSPTTAPATNSDPSNGDSRQTPPVDAHVPTDATGNDPSDTAAPPSADTSDNSGQADDSSGDDSSDSDDVGD